MLFDHLRTTLRNRATICNFLLSWHCLVRWYNFHLLYHVSLTHHQSPHAVGEYVVKRSRRKDEGKSHPTYKQRKAVGEPIFVWFLLDDCDGLLHRDFDSVVEEGKSLREVVTNFHFGEWSLYGNSSLDRCVELLGGIAKSNLCKEIFLNDRIITSIRIVEDSPFFCTAVSSIWHRLILLNCVLDSARYAVNSSFCIWRSNSRIPDLLVLTN